MREGEGAGRGGDGGSSEDFIRPTVGSGNSLKLNHSS